jgi:hypothetical protein
MSKFFSRRSKSAARGGLPAPGYFLEWAGMLVVLFVIVQLAGLREFTSVLNGTVGSTSMDWRTAFFLGTAYVIVYLGFVVVAPILVVAAFILKLWQRVVATKGATDESRTNVQKD